MSKTHAGSLQSAAWPDMFDSLQTAYAQLNETQFELERRISEVDETRDLFERVIDSMSEALVLTDRTGDVLRVNRAAAALLGVRPETATGRPLAEVWPAEGIPTTPWALIERSPDGMVSSLGVDLPGEDGDARHLSVSCGLLRDRFGAISGLLLVARDVTAPTIHAETQQFLSDASAVLGRSLSARKMLRDVARLCVPGLADRAVVVMQQGGEAPVVATADRRPLEARPPRPEKADRPAALVAALESGRATVREDDPPGSGCTAAVPLVARGRVLGGIALSWEAVTPARRERALEVAGELAHRAALAIDNARLHAAERRSRQEAERVAERLRRVQNVTDAALAHLDLEGLLAELLERVADGLRAEVAVVLLLDEERRTLVPRAVHGMDAGEHEEIPLGAGYAGVIAAERRALAVTDANPKRIALSALRRSGAASLAGVPLLVGSRMTGVLMVSSRVRRSFTQADLTLLQLVSDRVALAIENARLYERERSIAETLQRSLLPHELARIPGLAFAARYLAGGAGVDVGGDWYDVIALRGGRAGVVVGDVGGRGLRAATTMGELRTALRTYALEGYSPAYALERLNALPGDSLFATTVFLVIDPAVGTVRYASAGHLPPLTMSPDGEIGWLDGGRWTPIGVHPPPRPPVEGAAHLPPGTTVLLYTDGLVERRTSDIDAGLERLQAAMRLAPRDLEDLLDHVLGQLLGDEHAGADDVALLALRLPPRAAAPLEIRLAAGPTALRQVRGQVDDWLRAAGLPRAERSDLVLAVDEICANAIEHPERPRSPEVRLEAELGEDGVVVLSVSDTGAWRPPRPTPTRGFGLGIARRIADEVEVRPSPTGTTVVLRRRVAPDARV